jgi:hypothetical protein
MLPVGISSTASSLLILSSSVSSAVTTTTATCSGSACSGGALTVADYGAGCCVDAGTSPSSVAKTAPVGVAAGAAGASASSLSRARTRHRHLSPGVRTRLACPAAQPSQQRRKMFKKPSRKKAVASTTITIAMDGLKFFGGEEARPRSVRPVLRRRGRIDHRDSLLWPRFQSDRMNSG